MSADNPTEPTPAPPSDDSTLDLGPCCCCEQEGPSVRNIIMLHKQAPVPGTGWSCIVCKLPADGAVYVNCDTCLANNVPPKYVIVGMAANKQRAPVDSLTGTFEHDLTKHPEAFTWHRLQDDLPLTRKGGKQLMIFVVDLNCWFMHPRNFGAFKNMLDDRRMTTKPFTAPVRIFADGKGGYTTKRGTRLN